LQCLDHYGKVRIVKFSFNQTASGGNTVMTVTKRSANILCEIDHKNR
jgi:hypothetical protein